MLERLNTYVTRRAIARAMTEQCDIDESNVVAKNVHIISSEPTMEGFDIVFTINGEDGEQFKTSVKNDGVFGETYISKIELAVPKYDHEVYFITKEPIDDALYASSRAIKDTTMTRIEWLKSLHCGGVLDKAERNVIPVTSFGFGFSYPTMIGGLWEFSNLGHPIFDTYKEASKYATNANFGNVMKAAMGKIAKASKPKPVLIEVWGIKPLSKTPVMLSAVDAASFVQACYTIMESGCIGITMKADFRRRPYFYYNGRPVFTSKEAAQKCIDTEYGRSGKLTIKVECKAHRPFQIWGVGSDGKPTLLGKQREETFKSACSQFFRVSRMVGDNGRWLLHKDNDNGAVTYTGRPTYLGHPLYETDYEVELYLGMCKAIDSSCAGTKQFVKFLTADQVSIVNSKPLLSVGGTKHNPLGKPLGTCSNFVSSDNEFSFDITPTEETAKIIDLLLNPKQITKVSDIKCFDQLASVIGKGQAQVELFKVMHNESCWVDIDVDDFALALDWVLTPQGYDYWEGLYVHIRKAKESNRNGCKSQ